MERRWIFSRTEHGIQITTLDQAIRQAQDLVRRYVPEGASLVDDLHEAQGRDAEPCLSTCSTLPPCSRSSTGEPGGEKVRAYLPRSVMSAVNYCETLQCLRRGGMPAEIIPHVLAPFVSRPCRVRRRASPSRRRWIHERTARSGPFLR